MIHGPGHLHVAFQADDALSLDQRFAADMAHRWEDYPEQVIAPTLYFTQNAARQNRNNGLSIIVKWNPATEF